MEFQESPIGSGRKTFYYGWIILGCCMIISACSTGFLSYVNAVFVSPVTAALGVSRSSYMLYSTFSTVTTMIFMPIAGKLYKQYPIKPLLLLGTFCSTAALLFYSSAKHLYVFYIGGICAGLGMCLAGALPMTMVLNNWFVEKRGMVTGIAFMGSALSSALLSPMITRIIQAWGYSHAYRCLAMILLALMLPMTFFILKIHPADMNLQPYGYRAEGTDAADISGLLLNQIIFMPMFWWFILAVFILGMVTSGTQTHLVAYWGSAGVSPGQAAELYSIVMVSSAISKILLGSTYDRLGLGRGSAIFCTIGFLAQIGLLAFTRGPALLIPAILFGGMTSLQVMITSYVAVRLFGRRDYSSIYGVTNTILFCGVSFGNLLSALIYDHFHSYRPAWTLYGPLVLLALSALLIAEKISKPFFQVRQTH